LDHLQNHSGKNISEFKLALSVTLNCLLGSYLVSIVLLKFFVNSLLTFVFLYFLCSISGLALAVMNLKRNGFTTNKALRTGIIGVITMVSFEFLSFLMLAGLMEYRSTDSFFLIGMLIIPAICFVFTLPVNYFFVKRGIRHINDL